MTPLDLTTVITAAITTVFVLFGWIYTGGRLKGQTLERVTSLERRVDRIESQINTQLAVLSAGQVAVMRSLEVIRAEQRILHRGELGELEPR